MIPLLGGATVQQDIAPDRISVSAGLDGLRAAAGHVFGAGEGGIHVVVCAGNLYSLVGRGAR